jgi:CRP/FNR family cyclic AMP-dependent transcriptional regulator
MEATPTNRWYNGLQENPRGRSLQMSPIAETLGGSYVDLANCDATATTPRFGLLQLLPEEIRSEVVASFRMRTISDHRIIYQQGDIGHELYHIVSGEVRLFFLHPDGRELVFLSFHPGDTFGYSTLIDQEPLPHTAEAHGPVQLQVLSEHAFNTLRAKHRAFDDALLRLLCRHMRMLNRYFVDASLEGLLKRLATRLLQLARPGMSAASSIDHSQTELSLMLAVSRQTVNRLLKQLEDEGLVQLNYGSVVVCDVPGLRRLVASE